MISKRKLRQLYRGYLFSYSFEIFTPQPAGEVLPLYRVISNNDEQILFSLATILLA